MRIATILRSLSSLAAATALGACASGASHVGRAPAPQSIRVYDVAAKRVVPFSALVAAAAKVDLVFFGEQHDDPETHFAEFALLDGVGARRKHVILSLEMFERDAQGVLNDYLAGRVSEHGFLASARPWERYATDYRAMVQLARARGWSVLAANVPRPIANAVSRRGLVALDTLPREMRVHAAAELQCPRDAYFTRFAEQMKGHSAGGVASDTSGMGAMTVRFYEAQCVKDETMGESIAAARDSAGSGAIILHFDGAFHSDYRQGTVARAMRRVPNVKSLVVTAVPVADPSTANGGDFATRADFVILTRALPSSPH